LSDRERGRLSDTAAHSCTPKVVYITSPFWVAPSDPSFGRVKLQRARHLFLAEPRSLYQQAADITPDLAGVLWFPGGGGHGQRVPVLATRSGGVLELVEDGVSGRLVPRFDVEALTNVLRGMLADPESLRAMGQATRIRAERLLT
jgi:glycosyltransferase involved in cell wall biosynthesis